MINVEFFALYTLAGTLVLASAGPLYSYGRCTSVFNDSGACVQIADCQYILDILTQGSHTPREKDLLKRSQCGTDNTQIALERRVLVCCPDKYCRDTPNPNFQEAASIAGNVLPTSATCGSFITDRLVGGNRTSITEFPWMALIERKYQDNTIEIHCGGSLINSRYVLTAAHCVKTKNVSDQWEISSVRLGEWNLDTICDCGFDVRCKDCEIKGCQNCGCECAPPYLDVPVQMVIVHPDYLPQSHHQHNDIGLVRLSRSVQYTEFVKPICLPVAEELRQSDFVGKELFVAGWGMTENMVTSPVKLQIKIHAFNVNDCRNIYRPHGKVINENIQLCVGGEQGIDACGGDSGGPLMVSERLGNRDVYFMAGIVAYGARPCGIKNWPGIYTRVGSYMNWILSVLEP